MISQDELLKIYDKPQSNFFLLDVRAPHEFENFRMPGSVNIPINEVEANLHKIPQTKKIITICEHGVRSGMVEEYLMQKGFEVESLEGGLSLWRGQLETGKIH